MNVLIKHLTAIFAAFLLLVPLSLLAEREMDKESEKEFKQIEMQLIGNYLSEVDRTVDLDQEQVIKVYNEEDQLEYTGDSNCKKGRKIVRNSDLLVETETAKIYLAED